MIDRGLYNSITEHIEVGSGVINNAAKWIRSRGYKKVLAVCDGTTLRVAGEKAAHLMRAEGLDVRVFVLEGEEPLPDEGSIGAIFAALETDTDLIAGIGSGVIGDLCKFVSAGTGKPSILIGTAPSMDGFASRGAAMVLGGMKVTPQKCCPEAIFCDTDILSEAPMEMIASGLGDMLGKYNALADWRLSELLTGEERPGKIVNLMSEALDKCVRSVDGLAARDKIAIESLTEGLILSGIAMSLYGDSRPASGTEHHLAHYWEMRYIAEGKKPVFHGTKVGVAAICAMKLWKWLLTELPEPGAAPESEAHKERIRAAYGKTANDVLRGNHPDVSREKIVDEWDEIAKIARELPEPEELAGLLRKLGGATAPGDIRLDPPTMRDSVVLARERKKSYTLLQLLAGMGQLENAADYLDTSWGNDTLRDTRLLVLDMDGTIYLGDRLFSYTRTFLDAVKRSGRDYIFFTNNSSRSQESYIKKLGIMGIEVSRDNMLTSTGALLWALKDENTGTRVFIAGTADLKHEFSQEGYIVTDEAPDFAVLGFDTELTYEGLTKLCGFARAGLKIYGVNMDYNCPVEEGYIPDCGSIAAALTASTGVVPEFYGKPSRHTLSYILHRTGLREEDLAFIGDRLYTDIAVASGTGAKSVLVLSGETKEKDLRGSDTVPDLVVRDLEELISYL